MAGRRHGGGPQHSLFAASAAAALLDWSASTPRLRSSSRRRLDLRRWRVCGADDGGADDGGVDAGTASWVKVTLASVNPATASPSRYSSRPRHVYRYLHLGHRTRLAVDRVRAADIPLTSHDLNSGGFAAARARTASRMTATVMDLAREIPNVRAFALRRWHEAAQYLTDDPGQPSNESPNGDPADSGRLGARVSVLQDEIRSRWRAGRRDR